MIIISRRGIPQGCIRFFCDYRVCYIKTDCSRWCTKHPMVVQTIIGSNCLFRGFNKISVDIINPRVHSNTNSICSCCRYFYTTFIYQSRTDNTKSYTSMTISGCTNIIGTTKGTSSFIDIHYDLILIPI